MPTWWFVRHGESQAQTGQWNGSNEETPLSPLGVQQAMALADSMKALPIQRVLVSPYARARETARHAMSLVELEHKVVDPLHERQVGPDWKRWHNDEDLKAKLNTWAFRPPEGESTRDSALRAMRGLTEHDADLNTIIFAHGRILAGVLAALDGADLTQPIAVLDNCVAHERTIEPGTWARLLSILG